jgi:hypothetical protein
VFDLRVSQLLSRRALYHLSPTPNLLIKLFFRTILNCCLGWPWTMILLSSLHYRHVTSMPRFIFELGLANFFCPGWLQTEILLFLSPKRLRLQAQDCTGSSKLLIDAQCSFIGQMRAVSYSLQCLILHTHVVRTSSALLHEQEGHSFGACSVLQRVLSYMIFVSETKNNTVGFGQGTGSVWLCFVFSAGRCLLSSVSVACQPGALVNFYAVEAFES